MAMLPSEYAAWYTTQRGKWIGDELPEGPDFTTITQQEIDTAMERLNNRPRKRLKYQTPPQVFFKSGVALQI